MSFLLQVLQCELLCNGFLVFLQLIIFVEICSSVISLTALQVITGSHDCTIRLWDLAAGKSKVTLTNHKKSVRSVVLHPTQ